MKARCAECRTVLDYGSWVVEFCPRHAEMEARIAILETGLVELEKLMDKLEEELKKEQ